jgi:hypothetical protein
MHERYGDPVDRTKAEVVRALLDELEMPSSEATGKFLDQ